MKCNTRDCDNDQETTIKNGKCFKCNLVADGELKVRPRPIWHHTKKMYQGGRL
jgi:hypothetical protein